MQIKSNCIRIPSGTNAINQLIILHTFLYVPQPDLFNNWGLECINEVASFYHEIIMFVNNKVYNGYEFAPSYYMIYDAKTLFNYYSKRAAHFVWQM